MSNLQLQKASKASLLQLASEASRLPAAIIGAIDLSAALTAGDRINKFTATQATVFASNYSLQAHYAKDVAGVSMTLWRGKDGTPDAGKFTISLGDGNPEDDIYKAAATLARGRGVNVVGLDAAEKVLRNWMDGKKADGSGFDGALAEFSQTVSGSGKFDLGRSKGPGSISFCARLTN